MTTSERVTPAVLLVWMTMIPLVAGAQSPDERIESSFERAREAGVPMALLESKVAEGRAKGIPMDRIAQAVEQRLDRLTRAQEVIGGVGGISGAAEISVGADALGAGVSESVLTELVASAPGEQRTVAIAALTYLVGQGVVPEAALSRVREALARGPEGLANTPGFAGPPGLVDGFPGRGPPDALPGAGGGGPPSSIPAPGGGGPPEPPGRGPPDGPPGGGGGPGGGSP